MPLKRRSRQRVRRKSRKHVSVRKRSRRRKHGSRRTRRTMRMKEQTETAQQILAFNRLIGKLKQRGYKETAEKLAEYRKTHNKKPSTNNLLREPGVCVAVSEEKLVPQLVRIMKPTEVKEMQKKKSMLEYILTESSIDNEIKSAIIKVVKFEFLNWKIS